MILKPEEFDYFQTVEPERLREVYWDWRRLEYLSSQSRDARGMRIATDRVEVIEKIADQRRISLTKGGSSD